MGCTRVLPKSRVANPAVLGPAKSDLATKTNPEGLRSPPAGGSPRTPRRRLSFALGRRAVATGVPDDLPAAPESAAAAAAAPMGTPGNVPAGPV